MANKMQMFLISYVLFGLLTTGLCLQCEFCSSSNDSCTSTPHLCGPSDNACLIVTTETTVGREVWMSTYKGCTKHQYCFPSPVTLTFPNKRVRRAAKCCRKNLCNQGQVTLPRLGTRQNGMKCPGCLSTDPACKPTELLACKGWEDYCVYYDLSIKQGNKIFSSAQRGCGTRRGCRNEGQVYGVPGLYMEIMNHPQCTVAPKLSNNFGK